VELLLRHTNRASARWIAAISSNNNKNNTTFHLGLQKLTGTDRLMGLQSEQSAAPLDQQVTNKEAKQHLLADGSHSSVPAAFASAGSLALPADGS
jgi:hypothetical protein